MKITSLRLQNIRSIPDSGPIELGPITLLVGKNNTGKSTLLRAIGTLQRDSGLDGSAVRHGSETGAITMQIEKAEPRFWYVQFPAVDGNIRIQISKDGPAAGFVLELGANGKRGVSLMQPTEPNNFIYPYFSGRKVAEFSELVNQGTARAVTGNLSNLPAKVDDLLDVEHPNHDQFVTLVNELLNFPISAVASAGGKSVAMRINKTEWINISRMGEGVAQLLGLIVQLCVAEDRLFLLEEIENDIHPEALKVLLRAIEASSSTNQFVISTHNNIVLRHLGAIDSTKIYDVRSSLAVENGDRLQTSTVELVEHTVEARTRLLTDLGYELSDLDLHDGWIIFEESSAEKIIRECLIPWFAPRLSRVKTVSSRGTSGIPTAFEALNKLVLFSHLESRYVGKVLVLVDGEPSGLDAVARLRKDYPSWDESSFKNFEQADFEQYYPDEFADRAALALAETNKQKKREAKRQLLDDVLAWIAEDEPRAKKAFELSADEIVKVLQAFENNFGNKGAPN
jgi:predicted ATPase